ncbi:S26 family signal peptidase [Gluconacetobacter diazotrophicus]|uniref:S26 family signal peptidase n=2 Tax=Gluconacetobacter diazotrophicus TaxID=33996 RepID=A0A7W4I521_GLUDI|nr:S26 family signal peptidase [Gluconacetobacter diazotrophicus]MBB2156587.1 S26 family signal peptidase [Gluconacetobacter diazotrophicus]CAP56809.1 putative conjugal transfer protein traF [Gluconacetobacter diazotrophicus PA1 5]
MTRRGWFFTTYFAALTTLATTGISPTPHWVWNATASVQIGLYRVTPTAALRVGDIVALHLPERDATLLATRGYLPFGVPLLKPVAALAGQAVCRVGLRVTIDGKVVGEAKAVDHRGRPLPAWRGCHHLASGQVFVMNPAVPASLDGRYFGVLSADTVIGRATPVYLRKGDAEPPPPHFAALPDLPDLRPRPPTTMVRPAVQRPPEPRRE